MSMVPGRMPGKAEAKDAGVPRKGRPPVQVDHDAIRALFGIPQPQAAKRLGVSLTVLPPPRWLFAALRHCWRRSRYRAALHCDRVRGFAGYRTAVRTAPPCCLMQTRRARASRAVWPARC